MRDRLPYLHVYSLRSLAMIVLMLLFAGCADLQTVGRRTEFPVGDANKGLAIHLDAQQRLVLTAGTKYCAEPSPDALAAYASSLGFGISGSDRNSASTAGALQGSTGSIGLRTQSITLMRDSLYRMCEASMNGMINKLQAAEFLRRSQDLTAVILAIEQLTGAVSANQVVLTGSASAQATSQLNANQEALNTARAEQTDARAALAAAQQTYDTDAAKVPPLQASYDQAKANLAAMPNPPTDATAQANAQKAVTDAQAALNEATQEANASKQKLDDAQDRADDADQVVSIIENARDSSISSARAATSSAGQFSGAVQRNALSESATEAIATAVAGMVDAVLKKDYSMDNCLAYLMESEGAGRPGTEDINVPKFASVKEACLFLIAVKATAEAKGSALSDDELRVIKDSVHADVNQ